MELVVCLMALNIYVCFQVGSAVLFLSLLRNKQETTPSVINWQDYEGRTALHLAVADGNQSIVDLLVSWNLYILKVRV